MKTIKFLVSALLVSAMVALVGCQPQNQPTPDSNTPNTDGDTSTNTKASIVGVWQGDMASYYEYGEFQSQGSISDMYWEFDNKGRWIMTEGGQDYTYQYKLTKNNTKLQLIEDYDVLEVYTVKTITSKKLELEMVYLDDEGDEEGKEIYTFKRIE